MNNYCIDTQIIQIVENIIEGFNTIAKTNIISKIKCELREQLTKQFYSNTFEKLQ